MSLISKTSLFYPIKINKVHLSSAINCAQSDKPKLIAIEEARNTYAKQVSKAKSFDDKFNAAYQYIDLLSSLIEFQKTLKQKLEDLTKDNKISSQGEIEKIIYTEKPIFVQKSVLNGKQASYEQAEMERYIILCQLVCAQIDAQLVVPGDVSAVYRAINQQLKQTLGVLEFLKGLTSQIQLIDKEITETALELRVETIENLEYLVKGLFYINAVEQGILMNKEAEKHDQPPAYDKVILAGFAKSAENAFKQADQQLETYFKQDQKSLNKNYIAFIKSMAILAQIFKNWLYYLHFYDISVDNDAKDIDVENANTQKSLLATQIANLFPIFEKIKIKSANVSDWFGERFEKYGIEFKKVADKQRKVAGVLFDGAQEVTVQAISYKPAEAIWTDLNIPGLVKLVKKIPKQDQKDAKK